MNEARRPPPLSTSGPGLLSLVAVLAGFTSACTQPPHLDDTPAEATVRRLLSAADELWGRDEPVARWHADRLFDYEAFERGWFEEVLPLMSAAERFRMRAFAREYLRCWAERVSREIYVLEEATGGPAGERVMLRVPCDLGDGTCSMYELSVRDRGAGPRIAGIGGTMVSSGPDVVLLMRPLPTWTVEREVARGGAAGLLDALSRVAARCWAGERPCENGACGVCPYESTRACALASGTLAATTH